jgi:hypothetical protein
MRGYYPEGSSNYDSYPTSPLNPLEKYDENVIKPGQMKK